MLPHVIYSNNESRIMKMLRLRWRLILFIAAVTTLVILLYHTVRFSYDCKSAYWVKGYKHLDDYCNHLSEPVLGEEGLVDKNVYKLESVHMLIRHGDRSSLFSLPNYENAPISCHIGKDLEAQVPGVPDYVKLMKRLSAEGGRSSQQTFHGYSLYPAADKCQIGMLTPKGAAQHVKNGQFYRRAYIDNWQLIDESKKWQQILIRCTTKSRTFQSSLALTSAFLGDIDLGRIQMEVALNNSMCTERTGHTCVCPASDDNIDIFSNNYHQLSPHVTASRHMSAAYAQVASVVGESPSNLPRPTHVFDATVVPFCQRAPLPAMNNKCVHPDSLATVHDALNQNGKEQFSTSNVQRIHRLKLQPLMHEIAHRMKDQTDAKSSLTFVLYSGHDSTIEPFANAMGFSRGLWPQYASRIVLELYRNIKDNTSHIRVLYDGKVVTDEVSFCRGKMSDKSNGMCSLSNFLDFVNHDNLKELKSSGYKEACAVSIPNK